MKLFRNLLCGALLLLGRSAFAAPPMPPALADLAARLLPAVVSVASTEPMGDNKNDDGNQDNPGDDGDGGDQQSGFHGTRAADTTSGSVLAPPKAEEALGSGFVFDPAGYILTNNHVIDGATSVTVTFQDGTILPATVVGRDKDGDLAVLKVDAGHKLPTVTFGDSGALRVGDWVMAIGNPFGLSGSTSAGIVSALHRDIGENKYDDFIQTDAAVNRGNSGGPLFNLAGQVVGVNSAIYSPSGGSVGIGFAIPSAMVEPVAQSLKATGAMQRGWLGVSTQEVTPEIQQLLGLPDAGGALIGGTSPHGPADGALKAGDVLTQLANVPIKDPRALMIRTAEIPAGQSAAVGFWRDGALHRATLTIQAPPAARAATAPPPPHPAPRGAAGRHRSRPAGSRPRQCGDRGARRHGVGGFRQRRAASGGGKSRRPGGPGRTGRRQSDRTNQRRPCRSASALQTTLTQMAAAKQGPAVLLVSGDTTDGSDPGPRWVAVALK